MQEMKGLVVSQPCDQLQRSSRTEIGCGLRRHIYPTPVTLLILELDQFILAVQVFFKTIEVWQSKKQVRVGSVEYY